MTVQDKKSFKSPYHILIWIGVIAAIFMGLVEWGYMSGAITRGHMPNYNGQWMIHLGIIPYVAWLVLTYIATRPKWFVQRYNVADMFKVHRVIGLVSAVFVIAHWYLCFDKALHKPIGWWTGYISLITFFLATVLAVIFLTSWVGNYRKSISHKTVIWLHRLNLVAIVAANIHAVVFRIGQFTPFYIPFHIFTYAVVIYYICWIIKQK